MNSRQEDTPASTRRRSFSEWLSEVADSPVWHRRFPALAMLAVVSAVAITYLVSHMQSFTVMDGEARYVVSTLSDDPAKAIEAAGLTVGEYDAVTRNGEYNELTIDRAFMVNVTVNGVTTELHMTGGTVGDALEQAGVDMAGYRLVNVSMGDVVEEGFDICVENAISYTERSESEVLPYSTSTQFTTDLPRGKIRVQQEGKDGLLTRTYRDTVEDGKVIATTLLSEERTEPVDEILLQGTQLGAPMSPAPRTIELDAAGQPVNYETVINGKCTAYTNDRGLCGTTTSTGRPAAVGVVAVDPTIIPYGSELYVVSADGSYVYGYAIAGDTGGACRAGRIVVDLFMDTYEECILFGRRVMNVYVLSTPQ